jgi:3-deoxy-D-manno-octulosonate 8-phosphate phosphatase (KDO 8-P phosphatase)
MSTLHERLRRLRLIVCDVDGVLTDGRVFYDGEGRPFRSVHVRDVTAMNLWRMIGGKIAMVTGLESRAIEVIAERWGCVELHASVRDKARVLREMTNRQCVALKETAFLGDDIIDLPAMRIAGLAVAVADAVEEARNEAHLVLDAAGGHGGLRELVHRALRAQGRYEEAVGNYCNRKDG